MVNQTPGRRRLAHVLAIAVCGVGTILLLAGTSQAETQKPTPSPKVTHNYTYCSTAVFNVDNRKGAHDAVITGTQGGRTWIVNAVVAKGARKDFAVATPTNGEEYRIHHVTASGKKVLTAAKYVRPASCAISVAAVPKDVKVGVANFSGCDGRLYMTLTNFGDKAVKGIHLDHDQTPGSTHEKSVDLKPGQELNFWWPAKKNSKGKIIREFAVSYGKAVLSNGTWDDSDECKSPSDVIARFGTSCPQLGELAAANLGTKPFTITVSGRSPATVVVSPLDMIYAHYPVKVGDKITATGTGMIPHGRTIVKADFAKCGKPAPAPAPTKPTTASSSSSSSSSSGSSSSSSGSPSSSSGSPSSSSGSPSSSSGSPSSSSKPPSSQPTPTGTPSPTATIPTTTAPSTTESETTPPVETTTVTATTEAPVGGGGGEQPEAPSMPVTGSNSGRMVLAGGLLLLAGAALLVILRVRRPRMTT